MCKRLLSGLFALCLILCILPANAAAAGENTWTEEFTWINPVYADIITEEDIPEPKEAIRPRSSGSLTVEEAGVFLRNVMLSRLDSVWIEVHGPQTTLTEMYFAVMDVAMAHTGDPREGDYLYGQVAASTVSGGAYYDEATDTYYYGFTVSMTYPTTAEQDAQMEEAVAALLEELNPTGSDYQKFKTVYDWICQNVTYDYESEGVLKHTAYAALVNRSAVCQGYAMLVYRLAMEMGIDCRYIVSIESENHAWNIVKIGDAYYNVDATWDAGWDSNHTSHTYFLKCDDNFVNHTRSDEYLTEEFYAAYPMGAEDYTVLPDEGDCVHEAVTDPAVAATCTSSGLTEGSHCVLCGEILVKQSVVGAGHRYTVEEVAETCTVGRHYLYTCTVCGEEYRNGEQLAPGHSYSTVTVGATCTEGGSTTKTCTVCGDVTVTYTQPTGHAEYAFVYEPDCTTQGYTWYYCYVCGNERNDDYTNPLGHTYEAEVTAPTCTEMGYTTYTCANCYHMYTGDYTDIAAHSYEGGVCVSCGDTLAVPDAPVVTGSNVASSGKIRLKWAAVDNAAKYQVYRATSKSGTYKLLKTTTGTSFTNTGAVAGKTYYYCVVALDADGNPSEQSNIVTRTCDLPRPVVSISNVASSGKIKLTWEAVDGAVKYRVYRSTSKNGTYTLMKTTTGTSYTNTSAKAGTLYYYKVVAVAEKSAANSAYSSYKSRTCDLPRPDVSIALKNGKPRLTWEAIDGAVSYKIYRSTSKNGTYTLMKTTTGTSYTNTSAKSGTTYYYRVIAVHSKSAANSAYSLVDSIKAK